MMDRGGPMSLGMGKQMAAGPMDIGPGKVAGPLAPPNLRDADGQGEECGTCTHFRGGKCHRYGGYPVESEQVCDSFEQMAPASANPLELGAE